MSIKLAMWCIASILFMLIGYAILAVIGLGEAMHDLICATHGSMWFGPDLP